MKTLQKRIRKIVPSEKKEGKPIVIEAFFANPDAEETKKTEQMVAMTLGSWGFFEDWEKYY